MRGHRGAGRLILWAIVGVLLLVSVVEAPRHAAAGDPTQWDRCQFHGNPGISLVPVSVTLPLQSSTPPALEPSTRPPGVLPEVFVPPRS